MRDALQGVVHEPFGRHHPYEQDPIERVPRFPLAGQPVILGAATWPKGTAESVLATYWVGNGNQPKIATGVKVSDADDRTFWNIRLPAFAKGEEVTYRVDARQGARVFSSGEFSFETLSWNRGGEIIEIVERPRGLLVECQLKRPPLTYSLELEQVSSNMLRLQLRWLTHNSRKESKKVVHPWKLSRRHAWHLGDIEVAVQGKRLPIEFRGVGGKTFLRHLDGPGWLCSGHQVRRVRFEFASPQREAFYGLGERFNALNQRGNTLDMRVFDPYKQHDTRTYLPVPFLLSSEGYGIYVATSRHMSFDLADENPRRWSFEVDVSGTDFLDCYIMIGPDPKEIISSYTGLSGKPTLPPKWAFGPWMSSNNWDRQSLVEEQLERSRALGIPFSVLVIEAWSDEATFYIWNDARYSPILGHRSFSYEDFNFPSTGRWPDPKALIEQAHQQGVRVLLWQVPIIKKLDQAHEQHDEDERYLLANGYGVQRADGSPYRIRPPWFEGGLLLDVTNPEAITWWLEKRRYLLDELRVDGFKTDGGEHLWGDDVRFFDGRSGNDLWNLYPLLYVGAYHQYVRKHRRGDAITFSRSGYAGVQRFPCIWSGDDDSTWDAFQRAILAGLSSSISGIPLWGWDLAGFSGEIPSAELYLRAAEMATFCPIMQFHSEHADGLGAFRDRTPWNIQERTRDEDIIPIFRRYSNIRMNLLPYIYSQARYSSKTGIPLMRSLVIEYPSDRRCLGYPYQYLFGDAFMVAPVVKPGLKEQAVYLPSERWIDFWTSERHEGSSVIRCPTPKAVTPLFVRAGSIIPMNLGEDLCLGSDVGNALDSYAHLCFGIYPGAEGRFRWDDDVWGGVWEMTLTHPAKRDGTLIEISGPAVEIVLLVAGHFESVAHGDVPIRRAESLEELRRSESNICLLRKDATLIKLTGEHRDQHISLRWFKNASWPVKRLRGS